MEEKVEERARINREIAYIMTRHAVDMKKMQFKCTHNSVFFSGDLDYASADAPLVPAKREAKETAKMLAALLDRLDRLRSWEVPELEQLARAFCEDQGWKTKEVFMTLRVAVTGRKAAPPLFDTMVAIGRERCRRRLQLSVDHLKKSR